MKLPEILRFAIYCWVSFALVIFSFWLSIGFLLEGLGKTNYAVRNIMLLLVITLIFNLVFITKIYKEDKQDSQNRNKNLYGILTISLLEIVFYTLIFSPNQRGLDFFISIAIPIVFASTNLIYYKLQYDAHFKNS